MSHLRREIAVVGGGLAGYAAAIGLAQAGFDTVLIAPPARADRRTTALIGSSVAFLSALGVFEELGTGFEPLSVMRLIDDTGRLFKAPPVEFRASEIGLHAFGYNVLNAELLPALRTLAGRLAERLTILEEPAASVAISNDGVTIALEGGSTVLVHLCVGADGRDSVVRARAGIKMRTWSYPQSAIVLNFAHARPHGRVSTEFHTPTGPFTQVPLPGRRSSLVWVEDPSVAALAVDLKPARLSQIIEEKMHSILGAVEAEDGVQAFPLSGASASKLTAPRTALIGEAAHVFPPIGAQGLNLGLRDAAALVEAVSRGRDDPGQASVLAAYEGHRRADVVTRTVGVDLLNRSLLADFLPVQATRSAGLAALGQVPFLRRFAMREGLAPGSGIGGVPRAVLDELGLRSL